MSTIKKIKNFMEPRKEIDAQGIIQKFDNHMAEVAQCISDALRMNLSTACVMHEINEQLKTILDEYKTQSRRVATKDCECSEEKRGRLPECKLCNK